MGSRARSSPLIRVRSFTPAFPTYRLRDVLRETCALAPWPSGRLPRAADPEGGEAYARRRVLRPTRHGPRTPRRAFPGFSGAGKMDQGVDEALGLGRHRVRRERDRGNGREIPGREKVEGGESEGPAGAPAWACRGGTAGVLQCGVPGGMRRHGGRRGVTHFRAGGHQNERHAHKKRNHEAEPTHLGAPPP